MKHNVILTFHTKDSYETHIHTSCNQTGLEIANPKIIMIVKSYPRILLTAILFLHHDQRIRLLIS